MFALTVKPTFSCVQQRSLRAQTVQRVQAYKVTINYEGKSTVLEMEDDGTSILDAALEQKIPVPHDCKMGVCMTCPGKLTKGKVDQGAGMLSDDVVEKGYTLLCTATPQTDCVIDVITEEEILKQQLVTAQD